MVCNTFKSSFKSWIKWNTLMANCFGPASFLVRFHMGHHQVSLKLGNSHPAKVAMLGPTELGARHHLMLVNQLVLDLFPTSPAMVNQ